MSSRRLRTSGALLGAVACGTSLLLTALCSSWGDGLASTRVEATEPTVVARTQLFPGLNSNWISHLFRDVGFVSTGDKNRTKPRIRREPDGRVWLSDAGKMSSNTDRSHSDSDTEKPSIFPALSSDVCDGGPPLMRHRLVDRDDDRTVFDMDGDARAWTAVAAE